MFGSICLILQLIVLVNSQFPKILWTYWEGDHNQTMIKLFIENHQRFLNNGWQVRVLDNNSIKKYIEKIPYYQGDFDTLDYGGKPHKADYVRCLLLSYYGGVYFDMSSLLIEDFSWLQFENLRNNPDVLNKYGDSPDILLFIFNPYGSKEIYFDTSLNKTFYISPGYEIWFIAAVPNSTLLMQYLPMLRQGFIDRVITSQGEHKFINKIVQQQKIDVGSIKNSEYLSSLQLLQILIQRKQHYFDKLTNQKNSTRYLAAWHYKIWHIHSQFGPFSVLYYIGPIQTFYLAKYSLQMVKQIVKRDSIRYFFKFTGPCRRILQSYINSSPQRTKQERINPKKYNLYEGSILHKYLIENSTMQKQIKISSILRGQFNSDDLPRENLILQKIFHLIVITFISTFVLSIMVMMIIFRHLHIGKTQENKQLDSSRTYSHSKIDQKI